MEWIKEVKHPGRKDQRKALFALRRKDRYLKMKRNELAQKQAARGKG